MAVLDFQKARGSTLLTFATFRPRMPAGPQRRPLGDSQLKLHILAAAGMLALTGCATAPRDIAPAYVSTMGYEN